MQKYSNNWLHLKSILTGYQTTNQRVEFYSLEDHNHAKALSIFLAHATLATPKLDRETVESLLSGSLSWPNSSNPKKFEGLDLPLSFLEESGLVSFYANWCTIHFWGSIDLGKIDPSLVQLIRGLEYIKDICFGRNGYIQPYFMCPENELNRIFAEHFGNLSVLSILPMLTLENGNFNLPPENQNFSSLVSTQLWLTLRESLEPEQAFERWLLCMRVNCDCAMPVLFDTFDYEKRNEFNYQLLAYINQDTALSLSIDTMLKQAINEDHFSHIVVPVVAQINITISLDASTHSEEKFNDIEKPTLATLGAAYSIPEIDCLNDLQFVHQCWRWRHGREPELFYTWLLTDIIEASINLDGHMLTYSNFSEDLFALATDRPILKYMLFNLIPTYERATYLILLLSRPTTCDIAMFYLAQKSFINSQQENYSFAKHIDKGFQQLVCQEYLRTLEEDSNNGNRLLKIIEILGEKCRLDTNDFSNNSHYKFLLCLLDSLSHPNVLKLGQAFTLSLTTTGDNIDYHSTSHHYCYLLGFWLIERFETTGIDSDDTLSPSLKNNLLNYYKAEFEANLAGQGNNLKLNSFFAVLPWHKLIGRDGASPLLALSNQCNGWHQSFDYSNPNHFAMSSSIRHYLQVLLCVGRPQRIPKDWERVANRILEIIRTLGFGSSNQATYLFDGAFYSNQYDLWTPFCTYTNLLKDALYDDFLDRCITLIPLDRLFVLLECCTVIVRAQKLQSEIAHRQTPEAENLGLSGLEKSFISACDSGHTFIAKNLIVTAKSLLSQERFANTRNPHILRARKIWVSYEYKWQLMELFESEKHNPDKFADAAIKIPLPHEKNNKHHQDNDLTYRQECEHFRRYIIATAYFESNPKKCVHIEKCVHIMEQLCKETSSHHHCFLLFKGRLVLCEAKKNALGLQQALSKFLDSLSDTNPEDMRSPWVATILDAYRQLQDISGIDKFWLMLTPDQQNRVEILRPYCRALITRGEALIAQQIIIRYRELNQQTSDGLELDELINELAQTLPSEQSMSELIQVLNENSQRDIVQLAKHYNQIVSKEFEDYVTIVAQTKQPHEFLRNIVQEIAQELLLRKTNLLLHSQKVGKKINLHITKEDLINDWFTSLFDKRMAEARVGLRDQKRGGQSASGNNPGEIDGYITDAKNKRIAIFEAFRLFSVDTTVITEHLDKISGYDNEALSPVFIVAYCDVGDFEALVQGYANFISTKIYVGFTVDTKAGIKIEKLDATNHLWIGMERRYRNDREVIFYHFLLDMGA